MDKPSPMTLLDELTTPVQFRILKLLLPFFSFSQQRMLATWIKFSELQRTLELFSSRYTFSESPLKAHSLSASFSYEEILEVLAPYLTESERQMSENLKNMKEMLSMVQLFQISLPTLEIGDSEIILKMNLKTGSKMDLKMNLQTNLKQVPK